jgi:predicted O-linked N-acetylglucosamine transferase (SPINDLY family)
MATHQAAKAQAAYRRALVLQQQSRLDDARVLCDRALKLLPQHSGALQLLGVIEIQANRPVRAVEHLGRLILCEPHNAVAHHHHGFAQRMVGQHDAALASFNRAIALRPDYADAHNNRGRALIDLRQFEAAAASFDTAIAFQPNDADAYINRGGALFLLRRFEAAIASYDQALALDPKRVEVYKNRGIAFANLARSDAAIANFEQALALDPDYAEGYFNRGNARFDLKQFEGALADYDRAVALAPAFADAHNNRGNALFELRRHEAAAASYARAIAIRPGHVRAHENLGQAQRALRQYEAAVASFDSAIALDPAVRSIYGVRRHVRMQMCDWGGCEADVAQLCAGIEHGECASTPFCFQSLCGSARLQRRVAEIWARNEHLVDLPYLPMPPYSAHDKIRVGYFSAHFREHPVSLLIAELIESHDRSQFEVSGFSFGPNVQDAMRGRLERAFDRFIDVRDYTDREIVRLARSMELDIAVDLAGYTEDGRPRIFALRAAPLQVSYLGFLGTLGGDSMDYLLADAALVPPAARGDYAEKIIYLPSYQANDSTRRISDQHFARADLGLPPTGFVFCCFNANYKITPATFDGWMRILGRVQGSVLLLLAGHPRAESNLRQEAFMRGIDGGRLVFGRPLPGPLYLARYRAADLFLDTLPYNAGTTASDALWAGLPVLTCLGEAFSSRMAASLLTAVGLPELIAATQTEYEDRAVGLALNPGAFDDLKTRLAHNRLTTALFDTPQFTRSLEAAYTRIHARHRANEPPDHIAVA